MGDIVFFLDAAADRNQYRMLGDINVTRLGDDRLEIAASSGQSADLRRLVHHDAVDGSTSCGLNAPGRTLMTAPDETSQRT